MTKRIGIGVIGMGWMGMVHSRSYRAVVDRFPESDIEARLVICADDVEEKAIQAQRAFGFEQTTTDWHDVINHHDVQVVNIAAPNFLHLDMVNSASQAGKHIFCEKPVGRVPEETAEIEYLARQAGVLSFVGFNYRWAPMVQYAKALIDSGELGTLTHYRGRFFSMYGSHSLSQLTWRFNFDSSGYGVLGDLMSHVVDMSHMLFGSIKRVTSHHHTFIPQRPIPVPGQGTHFTEGKENDPKGAVTNEDYVSVLVDFENGGLGTFEACRVINGPKCEMSFELNGTKGAVRWNFERMNELQVYLPQAGGHQDGYTTLLGGPKYPFHGHFNPGDGLGIGYEDLKIIEAYQFLQSVADGKQRAPGFAEALELASVQSAIVRSWKSETWEDNKSLKIIEQTA